MSFQEEARAAIEGHILSMRLHATNLGITPSSVIATGGASQNDAITKVIADIFGTKVKAASQPDSASLGAAYRALHGHKVLHLISGPFYCTNYQ